jgi:hypothetical protein
MPSQKSHYPVFAFAAACLLLTGLCNATRAQSQADSAPSVAEAARRVREKKKENSKPVRTLTNDDLPAAPAGDVANGAVSPTPADQAATPAANEGGEKKPTAAANDDQAKRKQAENAAALERAKKQLATALSELDIMQRKAALDSDSYYSKTDFENDKKGKANLDAEAQQISDKKQAVEELKARVAELQALVGDEAENEPDQSDNSDQSDKNPPLC